ncbi:hypothetical protein [Sphingobacterium deserti]|uniref:Uncharacterized protein n=1 Tax=Sphingobacterium deserti TaxID=1229276 RepID=A0A0B8T528_9SPHI|nr:hypothetical protein [Sphingobacterium deserti]KGE15458.1 hypothetical protein DI53_0831 [Sphingobacterium deserti]
MKNIIFAGFILLALVSYTSAQTVNNKTITWEASDDNGKTKLIVKGEVSISDDDERIVSIAKNGAINYEQKSNKLQVTAGNNGKLIYRINKREKAVLDADDKKLLQSAIHMMISRGINAEARTKRLYAKSGRDGVLQELPKLQGDYARQKYLSALLSLGMSTPEMTDVLTNIGQYLTSDYYNAELLTNVMTIYLLDKATSKAYLNIVRDMKSDYYQYSILQKMMNNKLNSEQMVEVVDIVKTMKSDYYQSEVYKNLLKRAAFGETAFNETLDLVFSMKSDYYKTEIIKNLLKRQLTEADWTKLISYADKVDSDYYQCELILNIADKMPKNDGLKRGLLEAAKAIKSEYYYGKVMRKIAVS